jgi:hypothetical protein
MIRVNGFSVLSTEKTGQGNPELAVSLFDSISQNSAILALKPMIRALFQLFQRKIINLGLTDPKINPTLGDTDLGYLVVGHSLSYFGYNHFVVS